MNVFSRREILLSGMVAMLPALARSAQKPVVEVGIIRWDAWFPGSPYSKVLAEPRWRKRLPEFTKGSDKDLCICGSDPTTLATEAKEALDSGITYFAFNYYFPEDGSGNFSRNWQGMGQALRSFQKLDTKLKYSLIFDARFAMFDNPKYRTDVVDEHVAAFISKNYLKTQSGRPVIYILMQNHNEFRQDMPHKNRIEQYFSRLQSKCAEHNLKSPYRVVVSFSPTDARMLISTFGFDAATSYGNPRGSQKTPPGHELPFSNCANGSRRYWDTAKSISIPFIPPVSLGWDYRPNLDEPNLAKGRNVAGDYCDAPSDQEIKSLVREACDIALKSNAGFPSILIYAWNEYTEGGWVAPTRGEGRRRLDALKAALVSRSK
jgi:hypothetical protein